MEDLRQFFKMDVTTELERNKVLWVLYWFGMPKDMLEFGIYNHDRGFLVSNPKNDDYRVGFPRFLIPGEN